MRRSKSDRFIADHTEFEQDVSSAVYVVEAGDDHGSALARWRPLAWAVMVLGAVVALAVVSLPLTRGRPTAASFSAGSTCVDAAGYGGLGGRVRAFDANNNNTVGPAEPSPGAAFYVVTATARGCVTAFAVQDSASPPLTAGDLLVMVSHPYLPRDARRVLNAQRCAVWKSLALKRATGRAYAQATAVAQAGTTAGRAQIEATSTPSCQPPRPPASRRTSAH